MNRLFIDLMDTTAVNYVQGGLLIEAAKQGPCLLSDCVVRNDERLIDSRATGLKDEVPSLSHRCRSFCLSPPCRFFFFLDALSQVAFPVPFVLYEIKLAAFFSGRHLFSTNWSECLQYPHFLSVCRPPRLSQLHPRLIVEAMRKRH